ncbi:DNA-binding protein [bacterium]|nr:DNA-binding protein [bacterium]
MDAEPTVIGTRNASLAARLQEFAGLLEDQGADRFRVRAYQEAAAQILALPVPLRDLFERDGMAGLIALPRIGHGIAAALAEMLTSGRWSQLDRLRGDASPARLFQTIPGIGAALARKLADDEDIETLEELEIALQPDGRQIAGLGPRRRQAVLDHLAQRLGAARRGQSATAMPSLALLLEADSLYRDRAAAGTLRKIAPRRFNPEGKVWLPILHARRDDWHLTLLWSNSALAHRLGKTTDWVVVYFHKDGLPEGRCTIVTEIRGPLAGHRVVRGREADCAELEASHPALPEGSAPAKFDHENHI